MRARSLATHAAGRRRSFAWHARRLQHHELPVSVSVAHATTQPTAPAPPPLIFKFKHFDLHQELCSTRVGTDAMLLGAWAVPAPSAQRILDIGTGTGVLALMMAQHRCGAPDAGGAGEQSPTAGSGSRCGSVAIDAIDVDAGAATQAAANAAASPWARHIAVHHAPLQAWAPAAAAAGIAYDHIVSNPPFFVRASKPGGTQRAAARHADVALPFADLAAAARLLLAPAGALHVVLPVTEARLFAAEAAAVGLGLTRVLQVHTRGGDAQPRRLVLQLRRSCCGDGGSGGAIDGGNGGGGGSIGGNDGSRHGDGGQSSDGSATPASCTGCVDGAQGQASSRVLELLGSCPIVACGISERFDVTEPQLDPSTGRLRMVYTAVYRQLTREFHHPSAFAK